MRLIILMLASGLLWGCGGDSEPTPVACTPGTTQFCDCLVNGQPAQGVQTCQPGGASWGVCACEGSTPDASGPLDTIGSGMGDSSNPSGWDTGGGSGSDTPPGNDTQPKDAGAAICGDGTLNANEACDDSNTMAGDGCDSACKIESGWTCQNPGAACVDIDECTAEPPPCDTNATCTNSPGTFTCACNEGWKGDGTVCKDAEACGAQAKCQEWETCVTAEEALAMSTSCHPEEECCRCNPNTPGACPTEDCSAESCKPGLTCVDNWHQDVPLESGWNGWVMDRECTTGFEGTRCDSDAACKAVVHEFANWSYSTKLVCAWSANTRKCQEKKPGDSCVAKTDCPPQITVHSYFPNEKKFFYKDFTGCTCGGKTPGNPCQSGGSMSLSWITFPPNDCPQGPHQSPCAIYECACKGCSDWIEAGTP